MTAERSSVLRAGFDLARAGNFPSVASNTLAALVLASVVAASGSAGVRELKVVGRFHESGPGVPIGRPIANVWISVVDAHMQPLPAGVTGQLLIGGAGLAWGTAVMRW